MKYLLIITLLSALAFGAPAYQAKRTFTQPDGSKVEYRNQGDEYLHWKEDKEGNILLLNEDSEALEFAEIREGDLVPSGEVYTKNNQLRAASKSSKSHHLNKSDLEQLYQQKRQHKHRSSNR